MKNRLLIFLLILFILFIWFAIEKPFYTVPILNYHSINAIGARTDTPVISPEVFEKQMDFMRRSGLRVISMDEYIKSLKSHRKLKNVAVITIDDGYADYYNNGFPILKKYNFPATVFLIINKIGINPTFLNYAQVKEMERNGITFGSHTISHHYLPEIKDEERLRKEIFASKDALEKLLMHRVDYFCYPLGGYNEHIMELVKQAGYTAALTTNRGNSKLNKNIYALKRVKMNNSDDYWLMLRYKTSGYFLLFQSFKKPGE